MLRFKEKEIWKNDDVSVVHRFIVREDGTEVSDCIYVADSDNLVFFDIDDFLEVCKIVLKKEK